MAGKGMTFVEMVAMAQEGPAAERSKTPPQTNTGRGDPQIPQGDPKGSRCKAKKKRPYPKGVGGVIDLSDEEGKLLKRSRHGKEVRSPRLNLDGLTLSDYDQYKEDPLGAASDICKAAAQLLRRLKREEEERFAGLKSKRDEALAKAKEAKEKLDALTKKVQLLESSEAKLKKDVDVKVAGLEGTIARLRGVTKDLKLELHNAKKQREDAQAATRRCAQEGVRIAREQFDNALEQVQFRHPEIMLDRGAIDINHVVLGDQIVKPQGRPDGRSQVMYQRPA